MATQQSRSAARIMLAPAVVLLLGWMLVPLTMTLYFSFKKYLPLRGGDLGWDRVRELHAFCNLKHLLAQRPDNADYRWRRSSDHRCVWRIARASARSADVGTGFRPNFRACTLLRDANCLGTGLEEHVYGPCERASGAPLEIFRRAASRMAEAAPQSSRLS